MVARIGVDAQGLRGLSLDIKRAGKSFNDLWRKRLKEAGDIVKTSAQTKASWSARIPGSMKTSVTTKGVSVKAGGNPAPHAGIYESGGRHPVYGHDVWIPVKARPYLMPALEQNLDKVADTLAESIIDYAKEAGFR